MKQPQITTTIRRTSSLHLTKMELDRRKFSKSFIKPVNVHSNTIERKDDHRHDSISDRLEEQ